MQGRNKPGCLLEKTVSRGVRRGVSIVAIVDFHVLYILHRYSSWHCEGEKMSGCVDAKGVASIVSARDKC